MRPFVLTFVFAVNVLAQSFYGSLRGRVVDGSGAAAATARISLTDEATSATRKR